MFNRFIKRSGLSFITSLNGIVNWVFVFSHNFMLVLILNYYKFSHTLGLSKDSKQYGSDTHLIQPLSSPRRRGPPSVQGIFSKPLLFLNLPRLVGGSRLRGNDTGLRGNDTGLRGNDTEAFASMTEDVSNECLLSYLRAYIKTVQQL